MAEYDTSSIGIGLRLKRARQMAGYTRDMLAEKANVGKSSITYWEHAKSKPLSEKSMQKILAALEEAGVECSSAWILTGQDEPPRIKTKSDIILTSFSSTTSEIGHLSMIDEMKYFSNSNPGSVICKIEDDLMAPYFVKGDFVGGIWESSFILDEPKICIVIVDEKLLVREISNGSQEDFFNLRVINFSKSHSEKTQNIQLDRFAPVIRFWR